MSELTPKLGLFKYNPETDGKEVFSIRTALNNNWDIIDNLDLFPDQTGHSGDLLTTNGTNAFWKATTEVHCVVETYVNGTDWYRIYSDGWCEQGGVESNMDSSGTGQRTISLLTVFADTNYSVQVSWTNPGTQNPSTGWTGSLRSKSVSSFVINKDNKTYVTEYTWQACGYIE